ncbi:conjugative transposon protein TraN [Sphingobacteriaceae bacterium GW460-11-11-14-LB5]|nr:conjugative transposon protein TraN [Sphingobacteriaceae bacterium GW460-11-11-14-LB5]
MKNTILTVFLLLAMAGSLFAQVSANTVGAGQSIPKIFIKRALTLHFIAPEKITYVDIPKGLIGDLPDKNLLRIKIPDSAKIKEAFIGVLTILGEKRIKQYSIIFEERPETAFTSLIDIRMGEMRVIDPKSSMISSAELDSIAREMLERQPVKAEVRKKKYGIRATLNGIVSVGEFLLLDLGFENTTHVPYEIDGLRFRLEDQKQHKATTVQSLELVPLSSLQDVTVFGQHYRNIFVLRRLTFPDHKVLKVELSEKQISGRAITFSIHHSDILKAKEVIIRH